MDFLLPNIAYAANATNLDELIKNVDKLIINPIIILLFALAVVYFLWGMFQFIANQDNEEKRSTGKMNMIYGVIGMTLMMGVFTIMNMIISTFNISGVNVKTNDVQLKAYDPTWP